MALSFFPGMNLRWRLKMVPCILGIILLFNYAACLPARINEDRNVDHYGQRVQGLQDLLARSSHDSDNGNGDSGNEDGSRDNYGNNGNGNSGNGQGDSGNDVDSKTLTLDELDDGMKSLRGMVQAVQARLVDIAFIQQDLLHRVSSIEELVDTQHGPDSSTPGPIEEATRPQNNISTPQNMQNVMATTGTTTSENALSTAGSTVGKTEVSETVASKTTRAVSITMAPKQVTTVLEVAATTKPATTEVMSTTTMSETTQKVDVATEQTNAETITTKRAENNEVNRKRSDNASRKTTRKTGRKTTRHTDTFNIKALEQAMGENKFEIMREELNEYHEKWFPGKRRALKTKKDSQRKPGMQQTGFV